MDVVIKPALGFSDHGNAVLIQKQPSGTILRHIGWPERFRQVAQAFAAQQIQLNQAVARHIEALHEERVVVGLCIEVRHAQRSMRICAGCPRPATVRVAWLGAAAARPAVGASAVRAAPSAHSNAGMVMLAIACGGTHQPAPLAVRGGALPGSAGIASQCLCASVVQRTPARRRAPPTSGDVCF
ncbi:hypothetical protein XAPC_3857 [Xanthomonas citri pv. punicae str. LMG 859]|nr:hypothetical protein XAPC_3857 [Xanthomonas citri pv. punicae str. LMG 859]